MVNVKIKCEITRQKLLSKEIIFLYKSEDVWNFLEFVRSYQTDKVKHLETMNKF